jgi:hypothetical protein
MLVLLLLLSLLLLAGRCGACNATVCDMRSICDAMDGRAFRDEGWRKGSACLRTGTGKARQGKARQGKDDDDAFAGAAERWSTCGYAVCGRGAALARLSACLLDLGELFAHECGGCLSQHTLPTGGRRV